MLSLPFKSLFSLQNLKTAFERIRSKAIGADGIGLDDYRKELEANLKKLQNELISGSYAPEPLLKAKLPKSKISFDKYINELNETIKGVKRYLLQIVSEDSPQIAYIPMKYLGD